MKSKSPVALVLAAALAVGCGSGGGGGIEITTEGQVAGCLTGNVMLLLLLANEASAIINDIDRGGSETVTDAGDGDWNIDRDFSLLGFGSLDTHIMGTVSEPAQEGGVYQFSNVVITSLGGPITGSANVGFRIVNESTVVVTGTLNLNDASGCSATLTFPDPGFNLIGGGFEQERQLAAEFFEAIVFGTLEFVFDFPGSSDVGGVAVISDNDQLVSVTPTGSDLDPFDFKLLPETDALEALIGCFERFLDTSESLVDALDEVLSEALPGGEDSANVTIDEPDFTFDDGFLVMNGTIAFNPPSVTFTFVDDDEGTTGATDGPIIVLVPLVGEGTVTVNGLVNLSAEGSACTGTFELANAQFESDGESFEFDDGRTLLTVTTPTDTLQLQFDFAEMIDSAEELDLSGVTFLINDVPLPQSVIFPIIFFFGIID